MRGRVCWILEGFFFSFSFSFFFFLFELWGIKVQKDAREREERHVRWSGLRAANIMATRVYFNLPALL